MDEENKDIPELADQELEQELQAAEDRSELSELAQDLHGRSPVTEEDLAAQDIVPYDAGRRS
ncbi:hypothetical protein ACTQ49_10845 [Luteococcus sp. Sow4_B9]|uniref:hypothetical protein n=1 Tax=Luteococcus sp. Sow4_B9 TaxID=3438792 RepID=UPI003F9CE18B